VLDAFQLPFLIVGLIAPVVLIAAGLVMSGAAAALFALAGLCALIAGSALKFILVTRAGFNQGFALRHTPTRGSGAPGPAVKPGWSVR